MNFASDNNAGVCPEVMSALAAEAGRFDAAYGWDQRSAELCVALTELFERDVQVLPVSTGTAANAIALACTNPVWGSVLCHTASHIQVDECGAVTAIGNGLVLDPLEAPSGKLDPARVEDHLHSRRDSGVHTVAVTGLSLAQATEWGTVHSPAEVRALAEVAHAHDMVVHMDGARFANALVSTGASPAEMTWRAGVDILSFGATKGGALAAELVVVFDDRVLRDDVERIRKRYGHLVSKQRLVSAQVLGWLADGAWLRHARHANDQARRLATALVDSGVQVAHPVEANMVFAHLDPDQLAAARGAGAEFYTGSAPGDLVEARLVTSWATDPSWVDRLVEALG